MRQTNPVEASSYAGAVVSILSSLTLTDIGIIIGIFTALLTFGLNAWYTRRKDQREAEEHAAKMRELQGACHESAAHRGRAAHDVGSRLYRLAGLRGLH
nr:HP1 family phage holin [Cupriavidus sp. SK-4]